MTLINPVGQETRNVGESNESHIGCEEGDLGTYIGFGSFPPINLVFWIGCPVLTSGIRSSSQTTVCRLRGSLRCFICRKVSFKREIVGPTDESKSVVKREI